MLTPPQTPNDFTRRQWFVARATLLASATLTVMAAVIIAPSLPEMRVAFSDVPAADLWVRLTLSVMALTVAASAPLSGFIADRIGRKPLIVASLLLYGLAGASGVFATNLAAVLLGRLLLGTAVGGIMIAMTTLATDYLEAGPQRTGFLGLQAAFGGFGGVLFLPLGGLLADLSWQAPFWIYLASLLVVPTAVVSLKEVRRYIPSTRPSITRPDARGAGWLVPAIYTLTFLGSLIYFMAPTQLPFYLEGFGVAPSTVGLVIAASTLTSAVASLCYGLLRQALSFRVLTASAFVTLGLGWVLVSTATAPDRAVAGVMLGGIGAGIMIPNMNVWLSGVAAPERRGRVLSGFVTALFLGQFLSPLAMQPVIGVVGLAAAFAWAGGASLLSAALAFRLPIDLSHNGHQQHG